MAYEAQIGRMEARYASNSWTYLDVKRSKVKVTRPIIAHTVNAQYPPNGKACMNFELGTKTENEDPRRDLQGQSSRSQGHVMRLTGVGRYVEIEWLVWVVS